MSEYPSKMTGKTEEMQTPQTQLQIRGAPFAWKTDKSCLCIYLAKGSHNLNIMHTENESYQAINLSVSSNILEHVISSLFHMYRRACTCGSLEIQAGAETSILRTS